MRTFSELLRKLREKSGYRSARKFFLSAGGTGAFGCTYKQYYNIETGRCLPKQGLAHRIAAMLRVWDDPQTARKFAQTYLEDAIGQGPFLDFIQQSLAQPLFTPPMSKSPMSRALRRDFESHVLPFTAEQSRLIRGDDACYWTFAVLRNDDTPWTVEALSRQLGMSLSDIRRALANLRAQGLIQRTSDGRYRCPRAGRIFSHERVPAGDRPEASPIMQDLQRRWERMRRHHGVTLFHQALFIRASESDVRQYYPYFAQCIAGGQIYNVTEKGPDSALLLFEGRVERLLPF